MINGRKNLAIIFAMSACAALVSCGKKDADKVGEAQLCLDKATQATAASCKAMVEGIETTGAYSILCSANFITEGFTEASRFKQAFDSFDNNSSNNTESFMSVLTFKSQASMDLNATFATETNSYCAKSGSKGLMFLGTMATTATTFAQVAYNLTAGASGTAPTAQQINDALTDLKNNPSSGSNPATISAVGTVIASTYTTSCQTGSDANQSMCDQLNTALAGVDMNDPAAVGAAVISQWSN